MKILEKYWYVFIIIGFILYIFYRYILYTSCKNKNTDINGIYNNKCSFQLIGDSSSLKPI